MPSSPLSTTWGQSSWYLAGIRSSQTRGCSMRWSSTEIRCMSSWSGMASPPHSCILDAAYAAGGVPHQKEESIGRLSEVTTTLNVLNRPRLVDDVVKVLREKIIRGELPAGTQLLQIDLANQLGVSRTPLREAFRILENDGYLKTSNNNRTVEVVTFTAAEMRDMYEIREAIDGLAA